jgi:hypothetical protein
MFAGCRTPQRAAALAEGTGTAVFCHAPFLASHAGAIPALVPHLDVERFDSDFDFERWLVRRRARTGVLFRNPAAVIRLLRRARTPLTWFGGHVHRRGGFSMDGRTGAVGELAPPNRDGAGVDFIQVPSLGLHGTRPQDDPEYLLATLRAGRLTDHRYCGIGVEVGV